MNKAYLPNLRVVPRLLPLAAALSFVSLGSAAQTTTQHTVTQYITEFIYNSHTHAAYISGPQPWGAPGCALANQALIPDINVSTSAKAMYELAVSARATGSFLKFAGTCAPWDPNVFVVTSIIVT